MLRTVFRTALGVVVGLILAFIAIVAVELLSAVVHPTPADFKGTMDEMCEHVANYPHGVLGAVVALWGGTALGSVWVAGRIGNRVAAIIVTLILGAAIVFNISMLPYVLWFKVVMLAAFPAACGWGIWKGPRRSPVIA